jgi:hypothetical protein
MKQLSKDKNGGRRRLEVLNSFERLLTGKKLRVTGRALYTAATSAASTNLAPARL